MDIKEIKSEIRKLKKLKLKCRAGSQERIDLHRKIKELKKGITILNIPEPEKDLIISEIKKLDPLFEVLGIDLKKFTISELQFHLTKIKKGNND